MTTWLYKDGEGRIFGKDEVKDALKNGWCDTPNAPKKVVSKTKKKDK